jgi:hypothetical protein
MSVTLSDCDDDGAAGIEHSGAVVCRFDAAPLGKGERTQQGFLRIPAHLTRAGILKYRRADGTTVRELRPESEVFAPASLATLRACPVTDMHPPEMISPANVRKHSIGIVSEDVRADGELVAAAVTVQDADAISAVERGERREISCGYRCEIDKTPGTYRGERYDQVQRQIRYNHVALGPRNWGRAGRDIALRLDANSAVMEAPEDDDTSEVRHMDGADDADPTVGTFVVQGVLRIDGKDVQGQEVLDTLGDVVIERDGLQDEIETLRGQLDAANDEITASRGDGGGVEYVRRDGPEFIAAVQEHATLLAAARRILPHARYDGTYSARDILESVIAAMHPKINVSEATDEYLAARFDALIEVVDTDAGAPPSGPSPISKARGVIAPLPGSVTRMDSKPPYTPPWAKPLTYAAPDYPTERADAADAKPAAAKTWLPEWRKPLAFTHREYKP